MQGEWPIVELGSVADLLTGFPFKSSSYSTNPTSPRLLRGDNVAQGVLRWEGAKRWSKSATSDFGQYWLKEGDVILAMDRPWIDAGLKYAAVRKLDLPALLVQRVVRMRGTKALEGAFLKYIIGSRAFTNYVLAIQTGTAVPHISGGQIKNFQFRLPRVDEQLAIAHILCALDDKIDLNRRMNETLGTMAGALFKAWFLDVDPVHATANALASERVLEIGDGYRAKNSELGGPGLPFIRGGDLNDGFDTTGAETLNQASVAKAGAKISRNGDVAFTSKGTIGRFARVNAHTERFVYSPQVCYWRSLDEKRLNPAILYCWMTSGSLLTQILAISGQTDMAPYASLRDQRAMEVPIFPESQHHLAAKIEPLLERQANLAAEIKNLAALRDTLLPKLISGELRIKAAEKIVEAVA